MFSIPLLIVGVAFLPVISLLIKLTSPGPIFYRQERVGKDGDVFTVIKYRSMVANAEQDGAQFAARNDSRITPIGAILRRTRMDEIPQVLNVLRGEMSLVGPRPERPHVVAELTQQIPLFEMRTLVKPGLTGWAQVMSSYAATEEELAEKLEYDLYYIRNAGLKIELAVLLRTVHVVVGRKGV